MSAVSRRYEGRSCRSLQLRTTTVQDDRVKTEAVQEGEREGEVVQLVGEDSAANPVNQLYSLQCAHAHMTSTKRSQLNQGKLLT